MQIVRIIILVLVVIYLLLAFVFMHISLDYTRQLKRAKKQFTAFCRSNCPFAMIGKELESPNSEAQVMNELLENVNLPNLIS